MIFIRAFTRKGKIVHDEIIRYEIDGEMSDNNIVKQKEEMVNFLTHQMRDDGCAPSIDLDPQFTLDYIPESGTYKFCLSVYGVWLGSGDSCKDAVVVGGKKITHPTQKVKLKGS